MVWNSNLSTKVNAYMFTVLFNIFTSQVSCKFEIIKWRRSMALWFALKLISAGFAIRFYIRLKRAINMIFSVYWQFTGKRGSLLLKLSHTLSKCANFNFKNNTSEAWFLEVQNWNRYIVSGLVKLINGNALGWKSYVKLMLVPTILPKSSAHFNLLKRKKIPERLKSVAKPSNCFF